MELIISIILCVLLLVDIKCAVDRSRKMDKLMRLVKRGEVSYIQFVNDALDNI